MSLKPDAYQAPDDDPRARDRDFFGPGSFSAGRVVVTRPWDLGCGAILALIVVAAALLSYARIRYQAISDERLRDFERRLERIEDKLDTLLRRNP